MPYMGLQAVTQAFIHNMAEASIEAAHIAEYKKYFLTYLFFLAYCTRTVGITLHYVHFDVLCISVQYTSTNCAKFCHCDAQYKTGLLNWQVLG